MEDVIRLISTRSRQNPDGTWSDAPTGREVLCKVQSVSGREFFEGTRSGMNPMYRFDVFAAEYQGEAVAEYKGQTYSIYRSYQANANTYVGANLRARQELLTDYIQLYAQKEGVSNGIQADTAQSTG